MNILRLTPHYYFESGTWPSRFDPLGGMQVQISILSQWLADKGIYQDVLTTGFPGIPKRIDYHDNLHVHSVRFLTLPFKSKYNGTVLLDESWSSGVLKWVLLNRKKKYDCIHVHASGVAWPLIMGSVVAKLLGDIPVVLTIHCSRNFTYEPMNSIDKLIHHYVKNIEKKNIEKSSKVVLLTDRMKNNYESMFYDSQKFVSISDCIAPYHLGHKSGLCCKKTLSSLSIPINKKIILFVGRISHEKGWDVFVEIANMLKHIDSIMFVVCGDGPQKEEMREAIIAHDMSDKFIITGFLSHKLIPCIMSSSKVLVMPSRHEELGGTSLEGIMAGLPVVASSVGGLQNIFSNNETALLVNPNDIDGFVNAVKKMLDSEDFRTSIINNAKGKVLPSFSPERVLSKYLDIYQSI